MRSQSLTRPQTATTAISGKVGMMASPFSLQAGAMSAASSGGAGLKLVRPPLQQGAGSVSGTPLRSGRANAWVSSLQRLRRAVLPPTHTDSITAQPPAVTSDNAHPHGASMQPQHSSSPFPSSLSHRASPALPTTASGPASILSMETDTIGAASISGRSDAVFELAQTVAPALSGRGSSVVGPAGMAAAGARGFGANALAAHVAAGPILRPSASAGSILQGGKLNAKTRNGSRSVAGMAPAASLPTAFSREWRAMSMSMAMTVPSAGPPAAATARSPSLVSMASSSATLHGPLVKSASGSVRGGDMRAYGSGGAWGSGPGLLVASVGRVQQCRAFKTDSARATDSTSGSAGAGSDGGATGSTPAEAGTATAAAATPAMEAEAVARSFADAFLAALLLGDTKWGGGVGGLFAESAKMLTHDGQLFVGRTAIIRRLNGGMDQFLKMLGHTQKGQAKSREQQATHAHDGQQAAPEPAAGKGGSGEGQALQQQTPDLKHGPDRGRALAPAGPSDLAPAGAMAASHMGAQPVAADTAAAPPSAAVPSPPVPPAAAAARAEELAAAADAAAAAGLHHSLDVKVLSPAMPRYAAAAKGDGSSSTARGHLRSMRDGLRDLARLRAPGTGSGLAGQAAGVEPVYAGVAAGVGEQERTRVLVTYHFKYGLRTFRLQDHFLLRAGLIVRLKRTRG